MAKGMLLYEVVVYFCVYNIYVCKSVRVFTLLIWKKKVIFLIKL